MRSFLLKLLKKKRKEKHTATCCVAKKRFLNAHLVLPYLYKKDIRKEKAINKKQKKKQKTKKPREIPKKGTYLNKSKHIANEEKLETQKEEQNTFCC